MLKSYEIILELLKCALWEMDIWISGECDWEEIEKIVDSHHIGGLLALAKGKFVIPTKTKEKWYITAAYQMVYNKKLIADQEVMLRLLKDAEIPVVILKGVASSQYYPHPELRPMGDIDFIVPRDKFEQTYNVLTNEGFVLIQNRSETERNIKLTHCGFTYELHRYFATSNNAQFAQYLDDLIIDNIACAEMLDIEGYRVPVLPSMINGLILLQHINQHLENGIGLRQIIDWMMFYSSTIVSEKIWNQFQKYTRQIGLEKLENYVTSICVLYLGMPSERVIDGVDEKVCKKLLHYILESGNFGKGKDFIDNEVITVLHNNRTILQWIKMLHQYGNEHWMAAQRFPILRPFASLYQVFYYLRKMSMQKISIKRLRMLMRGNKEQEELFDIIGAKVKGRGNIVYKNGRYYIK